MSVNLDKIAIQTKATTKWRFMYTFNYVKNPLLKYLGKKVIG